MPDGRIPSHAFASRTDWNLTANPLARALAEFRASGRELIDLTLSNPTVAGFDFATEEILGALANPRLLEYHPEPLGMRSAREAVAGYYAARSPAHKAPPAEDILLTSSTSEGYSHLLRLLSDPGDEILVPAPSYPLLEYLAGINDVHLRRYPLFYDHGWHIDLDRLRKAIGRRTRAIVVVHPNNPTGSYVHGGIHAGERQELNRICAERELALIADEVFLDYELSPSLAAPEQERLGAAPKPWLGLSREFAASFVGNEPALTFTLSGLSKIAALPQMKLAWIVASGPASGANAAMARLEVIADTYLSPGTPAQLAAPAWLQNSHAIRAQISQRTRANLHELDRRLSSQQSCRRLEVEAGWYAILRLPPALGDEPFVLRLLAAHGALAHPGHFYDFESENFLVISLLPPPGIFAEGIERLLQAAALWR